MILGCRSQPHFFDGIPFAAFGALPAPARRISTALIANKGRFGFLRHYLLLFSYRHHAIHALTLIHFNRYMRKTAMTPTGIKIV